MLFFNVTIVNASEYNDIPLEAQSTFENFIYYLNNADKKVYDIVDNTNEELNYNIDKYLHSIKIDYELVSVTIIDDGHYKIKAVIAAEGVGWTVSGITTYYELKLIDGEYKIVDTNLFDYIGTENIMEFVLKIFAIIGGVVFLFLLVIIIVIIIVVRNNKKKRQNLNNKMPANGLCN